MEARAYQAISKLVFEHSGIFLGDSKHALVSARIGRRMRTLGISDSWAYVDAVRTDPSGSELVHLVDAMSTNVTQFFRESRHFEVLGQVLRSLGESGRDKATIWCAAASSGEEPYSIAMTALQQAPHAPQVQVIASDISTRMLQCAAQGIYPWAGVQQVPPPLVQAHFQVGASSRSEGMYRVKPHLREMVSFQQINLSTPPFPISGGLDVIFCRNVMIYFTPELRRRLVRELFALLRPGGHLFVGLSENLASEYRRCRTSEPSVYQNV